MYCWRVAHEILIHNGESRSELKFATARQHMLISDNSLLRKNYFDSYNILNEKARIMQRFYMNSFCADVARSKISDVIEA